VNETEKPVHQIMLPDGRSFLGEWRSIGEEPTPQLVLEHPAYLAVDGKGNATIQSLEKPHAGFVGVLRIVNPQNLVVHELDPHSEVARAYSAARSGIHLPQGGFAQGPPGLRVLKGSH
jgi:hypothetical protein